MSPSPLSASEIPNLLLSLQNRFEWNLAAEAFEVLDSWERARSGSLFYRVEAFPSGDELVIKVETGSHAASMRQLFDAMLELDEVIMSAGIDDVHGVRPMAWLDDPAMIVMPSVDGLDLVSILRQPDHEAWNELISGWMTKAGEILAAYHASRQTAPEEAALTEAAGQVREVADRMRLPTGLADSLLEGVDWRHRCGPLYGDFGPGNFLGLATGDLYLIDPPQDPPTALVHRDIANFIFELRRQLAGRGFTRTRPVDYRFAALRAKFLDGYFSADRPIEPCDEALIALFEMRRSAGMARKRFPARLSDSGWFARSAIARRREVLRARACHTEES